MAKPSLLDVYNFKDPLYEWNFSFKIKGDDRPLICVCGVSVDEGVMRVKYFMTADPLLLVDGQEVELAMYSDLPDVVQTYTYRVSGVVAASVKLDASTTNPVVMTHVYKVALVGVR